MAAEKRFTASEWLRKMRSDSSWVIKDVVDVMENYVTRREAEGKDRFSINNMIYQFQIEIEKEIAKEAEMEEQLADEVATDLDEKVQAAIAERDRLRAEAEAITKKEKEEYDKKHPTYTFVCKRCHCTIQTSSDDADYRLKYCGC